MRGYLKQSQRSLQYNVNNLDTKSFVDLLPELLMDSFLTGKSHEKKKTVGKLKETEENHKGARMGNMERIKANAFDLSCKLMARFFSS